MERLEIILRLMHISTVKSQQFVQLLPASMQTLPKDKQVLQQWGLTALQVEQFLAVDDKTVEQTLSWLEHPQHHLLCLVDADYPPLLSHIGSAPKVLFITGDKSLLMAAQIAIVGSREYSRYGEKWTTYFAQRLAEQKLVITSGLALGIDSIAHRAVVAIKEKTIAVLGSGLQNIYPRQHQRLAEQIIALGGAVVSEFMLKTPPRGRHFPRRNRIISGLSLAVFVMEASLKSGSLITARYALEQGRQILALPGPVGNEQSRGTHWLIQQGADLVTCIEDIYALLNSDLHWLPSLSSGQNDGIGIGTVVDSENRLTDKERNIIDCLEWQAMDIDTLASRVLLPVACLLEVLSQLEIKGKIARVPGGYIRLDK